MTLCTLALQFDINQGTRSLQYTFSNTEKKDGALAGTFNFNQNPGETDSLQVSLTVTGNANGSPLVTIKDCTLVSVSNGELGRTYLSPFSQDKAVTPVMGWPALEEMKAKKGRVQFYSEAQDVLPVLARTGQWQISGYLTVAIEIDGTTYHRVFTFDPEGSAGGGNEFP